MTATQTAQQLDRCHRAMEKAQNSLVLDDPRRIGALLNARDEIDATIRVLRWRPRPRPHLGVLVLGTICAALFAVVSVETVRLLTEGRPAVEAQR